MFPVLLKIGFFSVYSYGFMIAVGLCLSVFFIKHNIIKTELNIDQLVDLMFLMLFSGVLGARVFYVCINWQFFMVSPVEIIKIWEGGLVLYGGLIVATLVLLFFSKFKGSDFFVFSDALIPFLALSQGFGRIGCFLNGCCWGKACDCFIGVKFPHLNHIVHPVQLYSALGLFLLFVFLVFLYRRKPFTGIVTFSYFLIYPVFRFVIQFFRGDQEKIIFFMDRPQVISIVMFLVAVLFFIIKFRRFKVERKNGVH